MRVALASLALILSLACCSQRIPVLQVFPRDKTREMNGHTLSLETFDLALVLNSTFNRKTPIPVMLDHGAGPHGEAAVGWIRECEIRSSGLWCYFDWTQFGRDVACRGQWRFVSPRFGAVKIEQTGDVIHPAELIEVSLVNLPALQGMAPVDVPPCTERLFGSGVEIGPEPLQDRHTLPK